MDMSWNETEYISRGGIIEYDAENISVDDGEELDRHTIDEVVRSRSFMLSNFNISAKDYPSIELFSLIVFRRGVNCG